MPERSLDAGDSQQSAQATGQAQISDSIQARTVLFSHEISTVLGIPLPVDMFQNIQVPQELRDAFNIFSSGGAYSISGSGMGSRDLRALGGMAEEAARYGIIIEVDMESKTFRITNSNYVPLNGMDPEGHAQLLSVLQQGQQCLEDAQSLLSQGREGEAGELLNRAKDIQELYSFYIRGLMETGNGMTLAVDFHEGTATSFAYAPMRSLSQESQDILTNAIETGQGYLQVAASIFIEPGVSAERVAEAEGYLERARGIQEVYATYLRESVNLDSVQAASGRVDSEPRAGGTERAARELVSIMTGREPEEISGAELPAEFERLMGIRYTDFLTTENGGGLREIARQDYAEAARLYEGGLATILSDSLQALYNGDMASFSSLQEQASASFQDAGAYAASGKMIILDARNLAVSREGSGRMDEVDLDFIFTVSRAEYQPEAVMEGESAAMLLPGYTDHRQELAGERDYAIGNFRQAESYFMEAALYRGAMASTTGQAQEFAQKAEAAEAQALTLLGEAGRATESLHTEVAGLLRYSSAIETLTSVEFTSNLRNVDPSLIGMRDGIVADLRSAVEGGGTVENLDARLRSLEYYRIAALWDNSNFDGVNGERAFALLDQKRDALVQGLRGAADRMAEFEGLDGMQAELLGLYKEAAEFESVVNGAAGYQLARLDAIGQGASESASAFRELTSKIPNDFTYVSGGVGDMAARDVTVHMEGDKGFVTMNVDAAERAVGEQSPALKSQIEQWRDGMIASYVPGQLVADRDATGLEGRYGVNRSDRFAEYRDLGEGVDGLERSVRISFSTATTDANEMINNYNEAAAEANRQEGLRSGFDLFDPMMVPLLLFPTVRALEAGARGIEAAWQGIQEMAKTSNFWSGVESGIRLIPTFVTITQAAYGTARLTTADSAEDYIAAGLSFGSMGLWNVPGMLGMTERAVALWADYLGFAGSAMAVGVGLGQAVERGTPEGWWDFTKTTALASLGGYFSALGIRENIMTPFGMHPVFEGGTVGSDLFFGPLQMQEQLATAGAGFSSGMPLLARRPLREFSQEAAEAEIRQAAAMSAERTGGELPYGGMPGAGRTPAPQEQIVQETQVAEQRAAEDQEAVRALSQEYAQVQKQASSGRAMNISPEVNDMVRMSFLHPEWAGDAERLATEYVKFLRMNDLPIPGRILGRMSEAPAAFMPTQAMESPLASAQTMAPAAARQPDFVVETGIPLNARQVEASASVLPPAQRGYMLEQLGGKQVDQATVDNAVAVLGGREGVEGSFNGVLMQESMGGNAGAMGAAVNGFYDDTGRIIAFGNIQNISEETLQRGKMFTLRVDHQTGTISRVSVDEGEVPQSLASLQGMRVAEPVSFQRPAAGAVEMPTSAAGVVVDDVLAAERLVTQYRSVDSALQRGATVIAQPEVMEMQRIMAANPGMEASEAAALYVNKARQEGRQLPEWMLGITPQGRPVVFPTLVELRNPADVQAARARGELVIGPPLTDGEYRSGLMALRGQDRIFLDNRFHNAIPDEATMSNALAVFGDRVGQREGIAGSFRQALIDGRITGDSVRVGAYIDDTGRIVAFGGNVPQEVREAAELVSIKVNVNTGRIMEVAPTELGRELPTTVTSLVGMQVAPARVGAVQAVSAAPMAAEIPAEIIEHYSTTFNMGEITDMWENLQRGIFVTPRAGTEAQAVMLYEDFIKMAAGQSVTGEVSGILIRGDMSGVNIGNAILGTDVMDRTIMVRMRGVRETVMETAERLGLEGVTPVFTRRPGRSDEFMIAIFGPGDSVTAHADEFIAALREAPSGRITELAEAQQYGGRSLADIAASGLEHPESITKFKFDYAEFSVDATTTMGFLDEAAGRAVEAGSAAHSPVVADALDIKHAELLFVPDRSIRPMQPGEIVQGSVFDISFRMPPSVQQEVEAELGGFLLPRLDDMVERHLITRAESEAISESINMHGGSLPIDDAARYLFRKGTGQALSGEMRIKLLNALVGEERFNFFANAVDKAVADYAREQGIIIERVSGSPTMQYAMPGISGAEAAARQQEIAAFVYDRLTGRNMEQLVPSVRVFDAPEGLTAAGVDMFLGAQRSGGVPVAASAAGDFAVTVFGSGREEYVSYIMDLVPPQSRAAMQEILEIVREGRGITKLNDLYEVLQRTDPALYENFISIMERPETIEGLMRIMPAEAAENLRHLSEMPF